MTAPCKIPIGLNAALGELGVSPAEVLRIADLPNRVLASPGERVSVPEYFNLWRAIAAVSAEPNIGIRLAQSVRSDFTEPLFLALLSAADVASAIDIVATYKRILSPEDLDVSTDGATGEVTLAYVWPEEEDLPAVLADVELAFIVEMLRRATMVPELRPRAVHLRRAALAAGAEHAAFFGCPLRLGAASNAVVFAGADMKRPFSTYNPQMLNALLPYLQANTPASPRSAVARVRSVIAERLRGKRPTVDTVGKELGMSGRALQRLLQENGTSFRQVLDEVRSQHARGYLSATAFSDSEVAFLLGFEDPNSFYRAFRAWNGMAPSEFRRQPHVK